MKLSLKKYKVQLVAKRFRTTRKQRVQKCDHCDRKLKFEEEQSSVSFGPYKFNFCRKPFPEFEDMILCVSGTVRLNKTILGYINGFIFNRSQCDRLYEICSFVCNEAQHCAIEFFTSDGKLQPHMRGKVGLACNRGGYLHVDKVFIRDSYRGKDLGLKLFESLLEYTAGLWSIAFIQPAPIRFEHHPSSSFSEAVTKLSQYFARLGFTQCSDNPASNQNGFWCLEASTYIPSQILTKEQSKLITVTLPLPHHPVVEELDKEVVRLIVEFDASEGHQLAEFTSQVRELVAQGADLTASFALHFAVLRNDSLIPPLIELGAAVDNVGDGGNTALHMAAKTLNRNAVSRLKTHAADATLRNMEGETPLQCAIKSMMLREAYSGTLVELTEGIQAANAIRSEMIAGGECLAMLR